jgi:cob(I)alamin adenosyltransferase
MKHLYFGDGKGKTTAAVGIAVRAAGSNLKVLTFCPADLKFTFQMNEKEKAQAAKIFKGIFDHSVTLALTEKYDMVVFDEIIDAINAEMLTESEVVEFITNAPSSMEIIMTGHNPSQKMIDLCDYVTEFKKIKHPYDRGITGRIGVEF